MSPVVGFPPLSNPYASGREDLDGSARAIRAATRILAVGACGIGAAVLLAGTAMADDAQSTPGADTQAEGASNGRLAPDTGDSLAQPTDEQVEKANRKANRKATRKENRRQEEQATEQQGEQATGTSGSVAVETVEQPGGTEATQADRPSGTVVEASQLPAPDGAPGAAADDAVLISAANPASSTAEAVPAAPAAEPTGEPTTASGTTMRGIDPALEGYALQLAQAGSPADAEVLGSAQTEPASTPGASGVNLTPEEWELLAAALAELPPESTAAAPGPESSTPGGGAQGVLSASTDPEAAGTSDTASAELPQPALLSDVTLPPLDPARLTDPSRSGVGVRATAKPDMMDGLTQDSLLTAVKAFGGALTDDEQGTVDEAAMKLLLAQLPSNLVNRLVTAQSGSSVAGGATGTAISSIATGLLADTPLDGQQIVGATAGEAAKGALADTGVGPVAGSVVSQLISNGKIDPDQLVDPAVSGATDLLSKSTDPILGGLASPVLKSFITGNLSQKDAIGGIVSAAGAGFGPAGILGATALNFALNAIFHFDRQDAIRNAGKQRDIAAGNLDLEATRDADVGTDPATRTAYISPRTGRTVIDPRTGSAYLDPTTGTPMQFARPFLRPGELSGDPYVIDPALAWSVGEKTRAEREDPAAALEAEYGAPKDPIKIVDGSGDQYEVFTALAARNDAAAAVDPDHRLAELSPEELAVMATYASNVDQIFATAQQQWDRAHTSSENSNGYATSAVPEAVVPGLLGVDETGEWIDEIRRNTEGPYRTALQQVRILRDSGSPLFQRAIDDLAARDYPTGSADAPDPKGYILGRMMHDLTDNLDLVGTPEVATQAAAVAQSRAGRDAAAAAYNEAVVQPCEQRPLGLLGCTPYERAYLHPEQPSITEALQPDAIRQFNLAAAWEQEQRRLGKKSPRPRSYFLQGSFLD